MSDEELIQQFVAPVGVMLTERVAVLATVYAGVLQSGAGYQDGRTQFARESVIDFLRLIER